MEIIEKFLWIAIGVAVAVPITQAFCMRGEWKRTTKLKDIYIQGCFDSVETLVAQQLSDRVREFGELRVNVAHAQAEFEGELQDLRDQVSELEPDNKQQFEYQLGVHLEEERMKEHKG